jgi:teichuronic acid biosynthesis glycosyltransferase TuaC
VPQRPHLRACLLGEGPDAPTLKDQIRHLHMDDIIRLIPACQTEEVARWMSAANLVTLPSYMEGCPNVVIEALSAGRPVVATCVGGIPELMDHRSGCLVPPRDAPALAAGIAQVLDKVWDAHEIAARHNRGWQDVADDVFQVLKGGLAKTQL